MKRKIMKEWNTTPGSLFAEYHGLTEGWFHSRRVKKPPAALKLFRSEKKQVKAVREDRLYMP